MNRLLPLALLLAAAIAGWWLLRTGEPPAAESGTPAPLAASDAQPQSADTALMPVAPVDALPPPAATSALAAPTAPGAASLTLADGTGRSLWLADDRITLWRMDATPPRAVASQLSTAAEAQRVGELPAGRYRAAVGHRTLGQVVSQDFDVRGGETASVALPSGVPDASRRVTVKLEREDAGFPLDGCVSVLVADGAAAQRPAQRLAEDLYAADDIGPRGCDVSVSWNREPPVRLRDVPPGSLQTVTLHGSAILLVTCFDDQGRTVARTTVSVRLPSDPGDSDRVRMLTDDQGRALFEKLPACDVTVQVVGDWWEDRHPSLPERPVQRNIDPDPNQPSDVVSLRSDTVPPRGNLVAQDVKGVALVGGTTTVRDVHLELGTIVQGSVHFATGEEGYGTVVVLARREPPRALAFKSPDAAALVARLEQDGWRACAVSVDVGDFGFSGVPAGPLRLVAGRSAEWFGAPVEVEAKPAQLASGLVVPLPPGRWIRGHVIVPPGASLNDAGLGVNPRPVHDGPWPVQKDGRFTIGPLAPGRYELALLGTQNIPWSHQRSPDRTVPLGSVDVPPDRDVERSFDLHGSAPGGLEVHVDVSGPVKRALHVYAVSTDDASTLGSADVEAGTAHLENLFGRQAKLVLAADDWIDPRPELVDVPAWGRTEVRLSLQVIEGVVRLQADDGRPLAGSGVYFGHFADAGWRAASLVVLDGQGCLHVAAPAGRLWFSLGSSHPAFDDSLASLRWPPEGEQPVTVIVGN